MNKSIKQNLCKGQFRKTKSTQDDNNNNNKDKKTKDDKTPRVPRRPVPDTPGDLEAVAPVLSFTCHKPHSSIDCQDGEEGQRQGAAEEGGEEGHGGEDEPDGGQREAGQLGGGPARPAAEALHGLQQERARADSGDSPRAGTSRE